MSNDIFHHSSRHESDFVERTNFFTDRAIYRPGQTVHFKGIIMKTKDDEKQIVANKQTQVVFRDANYQEIASLTLLTNEYGSFDGSFVIPFGLLHGDFQLSNENGSCNIKVEEYKRPTFGISFNAPKQRYKLNDTVDVSGSVDALAEFGLDNIKCTYRVVRQTSFPFRYWRGYYPLVEDEQIQFGEMTTDNKGKFNIEIKLEPSSKVIAQQQPVFSYVIYVDATNVQGETQSKSYTLWAGYNDLTINTNLSESVEKSDLAQQRIIVTNLSNEPVQTKITRRFYHIDYQQRYSSELGNLKFDRKLYDDETLRTLFPEFDYYASQDVDNRKTLVYEDQIEVNDQAMLFPVNANKFDCGQYYVELLSVDDSLTKYAATFVLFDTTSSKMPYKALCWSHLDKNSAQPGEKIHFLIGSSENDVNAWVRVKSGDKILVDKWMKINSKVNDITYEVKEEDRGILSFQAVFVRHNRIFVISETVEVPYENLKLDIELTTMRDVLTPGAEEQWKVIVRDYEKKPVVANLLASMYDASLDQFSALNWFFNVNPRLKYPPSLKWITALKKATKTSTRYFPMAFILLSRSGTNLLI
jgi:Large extracellular alpha-helical protein